MSLSWSRVFTIARREYLTTIRRKAFLFTVIGLPLFYTVLMVIMIKPQISEAIRTLRTFRSLGVVDSSGLLANAPRDIRTETDAGENPFGNASPAATQVFHAEVKFYPDQVAAEKALRASEVNQVLVVPADYLQTGKLRRYATTTNIFSSASERPVTRWLVRALLDGREDSLRIERVARPARGLDLYALNNKGEFELHDDRREMFDFLIPFAMGMLLGLSIVIGGQYLLQGVAEEKESRILESLMCTVTPDELLAGKLIGLGSAGLTMVGAWVLIGSTAAAPGALLANVHIAPRLIALAVGYFLLGYLFYGSIMTGIGAITNNMREAQQFSFMFTIMNFIPFYLMTTILGRPDSGLAVGLSMFPPMAPVAMMLRLAAPTGSVPIWQIVLSMGLLAGAGWLAIFVAGRIFRLGLLMHGKTPNLPEILRWVREA